jgi:hypothetical protein
MEVARYAPPYLARSSLAWSVRDFFFPSPPSSPSSPLELNICSKQRCAKQFIQFQLTCAAWLLSRGRTSQNCPGLLTFQRPNSRPYFSVISSAVLASFVSFTAEAASCRRCGERKARIAREPNCCCGCDERRQRCLAAGAATLGRSTAVAAMVGWSRRSRARQRWGQDGRDRSGTVLPHVCDGRLKTGSPSLCHGALTLLF